MGKSRRQRSRTRATRHQCKGERESLIAKLRQLPPGRLEEVEDFVDFLQAREKERTLTGLAARISEPAFERIWDNPEDAAYDAL